MPRHAGVGRTDPRVLTSVAALPAQRRAHDLALRSPTTTSDGRANAAGPPGGYAGRRCGRARRRDQPAFDRLLVATGSSAAIPAIEGIDTPGVFPLRAWPMRWGSARSSRGCSARSVLGGGSSACWWFARWSNWASRCPIAVSSDRLLSRMLDEEVRRSSASLTESRSGASFTHVDATRIVGRNGRVRCVVTATGDELPADLVILAKGIRSNVDLARAGGGWATGRGIFRRRVYAYQPTGRLRRGRLREALTCSLRGKRTISATWFEAVAQGETAGLTMLDMSRPALGSLKMKRDGDARHCGGLDRDDRAPDAEGRVLVRSRDGGYRKLVISRDRWSAPCSWATSQRRGDCDADPPPTEALRVQAVSIPPAIITRSLALHWGSSVRDSAAALAFG